MHVAFLSYREWSDKVLPFITSHKSVARVSHIRDFSDFDIDADYDLILLCGWSLWDNAPNVVKPIMDRYPNKIFGVHCAESDLYSGGTPLQHQIIHGLEKTKHRVFKVSFPELSTREFTHEVVLDLKGHMNDVLESMTNTSIELYKQFLDDYPNIEIKVWESSSYKMPGLKPVDSKISKDDLNTFGTEKLYNIIRCREDPYPNVYIEDEDGCLYFEKVRFIKK